MAVTSIGMVVVDVIVVHRISQGTFQWRERTLIIV
jgi:hypothetical protein